MALSQVAINLIKKNLGLTSLSI